MNSESFRAAPSGCQGCAHYYITHDASFPYGCRILEFKSRRQPWLEVLQATGRACIAREEKTGKRDRDPQA